MDMKISGSGVIAAGEYDDIRISGSGKLSGLVRCQSLHISGSASGEEVECREDIKISGSGHFHQRMKAGSLSVAGAFTCDGDIQADTVIKCSGGAKSKGSVKCTTLSVAGSLSCEADIEAETVKISGRLNCAGLLNAEEITIKANAGMEIGNIGGSKIAIYRDESCKKKIRLPLLSSLIKGSDGTITVLNAIEGDQIALENVSAPRVSGRVVAIGEDCRIDLVQYSEQIEIAPGAQVGQTEKI